MRNNKVFLAIFFVFLTSFLLGYYVHRFATNNEVKCNESLLAIKQRLIDGNIIRPEPKKIMALTQAEIIRIEDQKIVAKPSVQQDPFKEYFPDIVEIIVNKDIDIIKLSLKDPEIFEREMNQYVDSRNNSQSLPPSQYNEEMISLSDIRPGKLITAESSIDIKEKQSFEAFKIIYYSD